MKKIPASVSDVLLHEKDSDRSERVIMPITRYKNVLSAPSVVKTPTEVKGAPFLLIPTGSDILSTEELRRLIPDIV